MNDTRSGASGAMPDPGSCPICGGRNECAMAQADEAASECWCVQATIGPDVLSRVPEALRGVACVCARCAANMAAQATE